MMLQGITPLKGSVLEGGRRDYLWFANLPSIVLYIGLSPFPVIVTTRIITFLVGDSYKPSFATITGKGDNPSYISPLKVYLLW